MCAPFIGTGQPAAFAAAPATSAAAAPAARTTTPAKAGQQRFWAGTFVYPLLFTIELHYY